MTSLETVANRLDDGVAALEQIASALETLVELAAKREAREEAAIARAELEDDPGAGWTAENCAYCGGPCRGTHGL